MVTIEQDEQAAIRQFQDLCLMAGTDIRVVLEFGEFTTVRTLEQAKSFIESVDHPAAGILIDLMHINRSGDQLPDLQSNLFPYVQGCDFWQSSAQLSGAEYIEAAVDARCPLGEGEANRDHISAICRAPVDVSLEIRSKALRDTFPDPYERAAQIYNRCRRQDWV